VADHYPALASQARHFLKYETTEKLASPLTTDVFALDAITEMLETPLYVLSYLDLRSKHGEKILTTHELTLLATHLKYNLWINEKYDLVHFSDDLGVHLDAAMAVRREGLRPEPMTIDLGLQLLSLDEDSTNTINKGIRLISGQAAKDGRNHTFTAGFGASSSGLTIHCSNRPDEAVAKTLFTHCGLRKYSQKASRWFGLAVSRGTAAVRFGLELEGRWKENPLMDEAVRRMPAGFRPHEFKAALKVKRKLGRNDPCPCGSGRKIQAVLSAPIIRVRGTYSVGF